MRTILRFFMNILCRPAVEVREYQKKIIKSLGLGPTYATIHMRRGDKVGDEDIFYPAAFYLWQLEKRGGTHLPLFIMTDDYKAVEEFKAALAEKQFDVPVFTLCQPKDRGFNVWALRKQENIHGHDSERKKLGLREFREDVYQKTKTLMTEVFIASNSSLFIGTRRSNVSWAVWQFHGAPRRCFLLHKGHLKNYGALKGRPF